MANRRLAQTALARVKRTQDAYWDALRKLELLLEVELESTDDYGAFTVDDLIDRGIVESCPKCGRKVTRGEAFEDYGEDEEEGRTFYYCSERCRETH